MRKLLVLLLLAAFLGVASLTAFAQDTAGSGYIRVAQLSSGPTVVIFVDGTPKLSGIRYGSFTRWIDFTPGTYEIAVSNSSNIDNAFYKDSVEVTAGSFTTIAVYGSDTRAAETLTEDMAGLEDGNARISVLHGIQTAPPVNVLASGDTLISLLAYPGTIVDLDSGKLNDGFTSVDVPAGTYDLSVTSDNKTLIDLPGTELEAGVSYFVAAVGAPDAASALIKGTTLSDFVSGGGEETTATEEAATPEEPVATEETAATEEAVATEEAASTEEASGATADLATIALSNPDFSTLVAAVQAADPSVLNTLISGETFTIFAPTNEAFEKSLADMGKTSDEVMGDKELLTQILLYHVVRGEVKASDLRDGLSLVTLSGDRITVSVKDGVVTLNDSVTVTTADVLATNGVIHIIDGVLVPPTE
ncbi:MAG TPA: fasciclin domain-containing protein [Phototrophicaceae bacterium]|jgi:uncharacterized surface protein with fasciclin (FAS1) repeats|nr:fasciclin domain-containing protein [Phototrophicaceae bacterium]